MSRFIGLTAFGNEFDQEVADQLFDNFAEGNFTDIPTIKIVNRDAMAGGNGAFSADTGFAYLAVEFIAENSQNTSKITDVLLEEAAHSLDPKINEVDALGDEGDILSELVQGNILNEQQLQQLKAEDDTKTIVLEGEEIAIEQNQRWTWNLYQFAF